jgi:hypothetical protein
MAWDTHSFVGVRFIAPQKESRQQQQQQQQQ